MYTQEPEAKELPLPPCEAGVGHTGEQAKQVQRVTCNWDQVKYTGTTHWFGEWIFLYNKVEKQSWETSKDMAGDERSRKTFSK